MVSFNKKIAFAAILFLTGFAMRAQAQMYQSQSMEVRIHSYTPMEDIEGTNKRGHALMNAKGEVAILLTNTLFEFQNKLMEEHFNEKYMESDKYPSSGFRGKINEAIDFSKEGTYNVTVTGKLNIHGVDQERTIPGTLTIKGGVITFNAKFQVKCIDHKITIPTLVAMKVAEVIDVTVNVSLVPKK